MDNAKADEPLAVGAAAVQAGAQAALGVPGPLGAAAKLAVAVRTPVPMVKPVGREIELKFLVDEEGFKAAQSWPVLAEYGRKPVVRRLRTVYFDTASRDLQRHKMVLRMRSQRQGYMMTLKWSGGFPGGIFERGEIEVATSAGVPDTSLFGTETAMLINEVTAGRELLPVYETDLKRVTHQVRFDTSHLEVAFDAGTILAGAKSLPVREIEIELKAGDEADLYRLGMQLAMKFPVRLSVLAKSDRGVLLASGKAPQPVRATRGLSGGPNVDEAIGSAINGCLAQFMANWPAFEEGDDVGAIHQMRVAMRRLRAMLGMFNASFSCHEFMGFRDDAKHIASVMGAVRNLDVFMQLLREGPMAALPGEAGYEDILQECMAQRDHAREEVRVLLASSATSCFILSMQAFVARSGWRNALSAEALARLLAPASQFAAQRLERLHRKLVKRGKHLAALSAQERHGLRISLKKLRYAADLFAPLFEPRDDARSYMKAAARLQEELGRLNDMVAAHELVNELPQAESRAAGIILGWCSRSAAQDGQVLRESWRQFKKSGLFWA